MDEAWCLCRFSKEITPRGWRSSRTSERKSDLLFEKVDIRKAKKSWETRPASEGMCLSAGSL